MIPKVIIYGLIDPITNELRYVGKTMQFLNSRVSSHISVAKRKGKKAYVYSWIRSLLNQQLKPEVILLEVVELTNWQSAERFYISYFKFLGCNLTNNTEGGDTGTLGGGWKIDPSKIVPKRQRPVFLFNKNGVLVKQYENTLLFRRDYKFGKGHSIDKLLGSGRLLPDELIATMTNKFPEAIKTARYKVKDLQRINTVSV